MLFNSVLRKWDKNKIYKFRHPHQQLGKQIYSGNHHLPFTSNSMNDASFILQAHTFFFFCHNNTWICAGVNMNLAFASSWKAHIKLKHVLQVSENVCYKEILLIPMCRPFKLQIYLREPFRAKPYMQTLGL